MTAPLNAVTLRLTLDGTIGRTSFETEAMAPSEVAAAVAAWTRYVGQRRLSREDTESAIVAGLRNGHHREEDGSYLLTCAALWLAGDSVLRGPCTLVHEITLLDGDDYRFTTRIDPPPRDQ